MSGAIQSIRWVAENYSLFVGGRNFYDLSGIGQGPWVPLNVLLGRDGSSTLVINADGSLNVDVVGGSVVVVPAKAGTGAETDVAATGGDQTILAANANRLGGTIFNDSTATLKILLSNAVSSATKFTASLIPNDYYELPFNYTGVVKGIFSSATGSARVTELTA